MLIEKIVEFELSEPGFWSFMYYNNNNNAGLSTSTRPGESRSIALKSSHKLYTRQHISHAALKQAKEVNAYSYYRKRK